MKKLLLITAFTLASTGLAAAQSLGNSANDSTDGTNAGQVGESTAAGAAAPPTASSAGTSAASPAPAAGATTTAAMPAMSPQEFVNNAASGGLFEVQSSELALERSQTPAVQEFAQMMITDHTAANEELAALAQAKGLTVPGEIMGPPEQRMAAVQAAEGDSFDQTYMQHQIQAHQETIALFEAQAQDSSDPDLQAFAQKTLPTLNAHAEHAQGMTSN